MYCKGRPTLHFVGTVSGNARVAGKVYMTPDEQVRWSFVRLFQLSGALALIKSVVQVSGEPGQTIWRCVLGPASPTEHRTDFEQH